MSESTTPEPKVWRMDYRRLNPVCAYCPEPATVIGVASTTDSTVLVKTLCDEHGVGEQQHCKDQGMVMAGATSSDDTWTDATLLDPEALRQMADMWPAEDITASMKTAADELDKRGTLPATKVGDRGEAGG